MAFAPVFGRVMPATFDRRAAAAAANNGLLNNLVAYWPLNEAAGANDALDLHTNALTATQVSSPGSDTGQVYAGARTLDGSADYFTRAGDDALLSMGDVDMTLAVWLYLDSKTPSEAWAISKYRFSDNNREYFLGWLKSSDRFRWIVSGNGASVTSISSDTFGAPATGTWYLVTCWHDSVANTINISVNNGTADSAAHTTGIHDGISRFSIGTIYNLSGPPTGASFLGWNGRIGPVAMWKSAAGGGGVLTAAQRTALYNGGAGLAYAAFTT